VSNSVVKTEILGNDGVHEWGRTTYKNGLVINWMENLKARNVLFKSIADDGSVSAIGSYTPLVMVRKKRPSSG
jgi:hypothetical protein